MLDDKPWVFDTILAPHTLKIALPAFAIGRVREHEVKLPGWEGIVRKC